MTALDHWHAAWSQLGNPPPEGEFERLVAAYGEPGRHHHDRRHLDECFGHMAKVRSRLAHPAEVALALWYHDAVYDPRRSDNEERSAAWAERAIRQAGGPPAAARAVRELILATRHDSPPEPGDPSFLVDIDLAILGAEPARFDEYEAQIRQEYAWVAEDDFRMSRAEVLRRFASRPSIYATESFRQEFEARARANLARSLGRLGP